ncbi:hypothetical protein LTR60_003720, partial [Cryomyces antarcticus]
TLPPVRSFLAVETSARKRKATTTAPAGPVAKRAKRAALGAINYNAVVSDASPDRRKQKGKAQKELAASTSSPRKTRSRGKAPQHGQRTTPTKAERFQDEEDPTPRPAACRTFVPLNLDGAPRFSPSRDVSPSRSTTSRTTTESKRSKSPSRGMASREYMVDPIVTKQMDLFDNKMPAELHELVVQIDVFSNGCGIIPMRLKEHFAASLPHLPAAMIDAMVGANRHATGEAPSPSELTQIHLDARKLATKGHSEAAWNVDVHGPLLKKALLTSPHSTTLDSIVMYLLRPIPSHSSPIFAPSLTFSLRSTTARISPPRLLPTDIPGHKAESKMVDFGIVLQLPETLQRRIAQLTFPLGPALESLSQTTTYTPLRYNPVAVSIETKLPGQGLDNAQIQVSTWAFAQMRKLEELLALTGSVAAMAGEKMVEGELPVLPLVVVLGHEWYFLAMTRVREGSVGGQVETVSTLISIATLT